MKFVVRLSLLVLSTCAVVLTLRDAQAPASRRSAVSMSGDGEERESAEARNLFYMQRLFGNPSVDVLSRLREENERLETGVSRSMRKSSSGAFWECAGPVNIAGRVRALALHPSRPSTLFAGSASGGVWRSTNLGQAWTPLTDDLPALAVGALAIDPTNPDRIYAGTGEPVSYGSRSWHGAGSPAYSGVGVLRSDDGGDSWLVMPWPNASSMIHRITIHPLASDTVFAASTEDLWRSTNRGGSWSRTLTGVFTDLLYKPGEPSTMYAAIGYDTGRSVNGVYVSSAGGRNFTWRRLMANFPAGDSCGRIVIACAPSSPGRIYAAVSKSRKFLDKSVERDAYDFLALMVSSNGGETWERRPGAIPRNFTNSQAYYDLAIGVSPANPDLVFLGGVDWWRSGNGGVSFTKISDWGLRTSDISNPKYVHADQHAIVFKPGEASSVLVGSDGGVHLSYNNGDAWTMRTNGMVTTQYYSCNYDGSTPPRFYGGTQDQSNQRQQAAGDTRWVYLGGGDGGCNAADPSNSNIMYIVLNGDVKRSTNGGVKFNDLSSGMNANDRIYYWRPIMLHPANRDILYAATQYVYRMAQPGTAPDPSWARISNDLTRGGAYISDFDIAPSNPNWMYAVTGDAKAHLTRNLLAADPQWEDISDGLPLRWLTRISVDPDDPQTAYVAASGFGTGHAFMTNDAGQTWTDISGDLPDIPAGAIVRSRTDITTIFLATDLGVWYTRNGGAHWERYGEGLPNAVAYDMKMLPDGRLLAGTFGRGMWVAPAEVTARDAAPAPEAVAIASVAPQPASSVARITVALPRAADMTVTLYDARGAALRVLASGRYGAGRHTVSLDARALPPGVYFCRLQSGGVSQTRKVLITR